MQSFILAADPSVIGHLVSLEQKPNQPADLIEAWQKKPDASVQPIPSHKQGPSLITVPSVFKQRGADIQIQKLAY